MAINTFAYKITNIFVNPNPNDLSPFVPPPDNEFTIPICPDAIEWQKGQFKGQYWDYTEYWLGYPALSYTWQAGINSDDAMQVRQDFVASRSSSDCRIFFMRFDAETATWKKEAGIWDEPQQASFTSGGKVYQGFKVTIGKIRFNNTGSNGAIEAQVFQNIHAQTGVTYVFGAS